MRKCGVELRKLGSLRQWLRLLPNLLLAVLLASCDEVPRDPGNTLETVRNGELRVGLRESEPWAMRNNNEMSGVEVKLVQELALGGDERLARLRAGDCSGHSLRY